MTDTSAPATLAAPVQPAPSSPASAGKSWPDVIDNVLHYAVAIGLVAGIGVCVHLQMLDKSFLELGVIGVGSLVGIKFSR